MRPKLIIPYIENQKKSYKYIAFLAGSVGTLFLYNISIIEYLSLIWFIFFRDYKHLHFLFRQNAAFTGLFYISAFALLISDLINHTSIIVSLKGVVAYILLPTTTLFLLKFFDIYGLLILLLTSLTFNIFRNNDITAFGFTQESFKFGFSLLLVYTILLIPYLLSRSSFGKYLSSTLFSFCVATILVLLSFWGNLRLIALCAVLAFVIEKLDFSLLYRRVIRRIPASFSNIVISAILFPIVILSISMVGSFLSTIILNNIDLSLFSSDALSKTADQSSGSFGVIFGGRSEIFSSFLAWIEKPIFGWGSWASDPNDSFRIAGLQLMTDLGYSNSDKFITLIHKLGSTGLIPTHSVLLNMLVWSGVLGFVPVYLVVSQLMRMILAPALLRLNYCYPFYFSQVFCIWSFLFSPFGFTNRLNLTLFIAISIAYYCTKMDKAVINDI